MSDTNSNSSDTLEGDDLAAVQRLTEGFNLLKAEMGKVIVGQHAVRRNCSSPSSPGGTACSSACLAWPRL